MKVTFPHMGNLYIPIETLLLNLGTEVVVPPPCTKRTLSLGTQNSPEFACLPLKVNVGNYLEAAEMGADTVAMAGGVGPCRFGYYAQVQREILHDMGQPMEIIVLEPPQGHWRELLEKLRRIAPQGTTWKKAFYAISLAWKKACAIDHIEEKLQYIRPREIKIGSADAVYRAALEWLRAAETAADILRQEAAAIEALNAIERDNQRQVIRIAMVGEIYTVLEPFVNLHMERHLGRFGVEVTRSIYLSHWINDHLFMGIPMKGKTSKKISEKASPYLNYFVGGHGRETVGGTVHYAQQGYDGVIQVAPLTCMPEIVAQSILPVVSRDFGIPTMTLYLDEQSGEAGIVTRLEAFVDMIARRRRKLEVGS
ncbi:MAG: CoA protein activase [Bacillota bacterium]